MPTSPNRSEITNEVKLYTEKLRVKLAYVMSITFVFVFSFLTIAYYYGSYGSFIIQGCFLLLCLFCLLIIYFSKKYKLVFVLYSITGVLTSSAALVFVHDSIHLVEFLWMLASISLAYFFIGRKLGTTLLIISLITIFVFVFYSLDFYLVTIVQPSTYQRFILSTEMILGFGINIYLFYLYIRINRFTNLKLSKANHQLILQNLRIKNQNDEKTILIKEVYHRVKNNLQIIISLLRIQSEKIRSQEVKEYFQESINQIMAISLVHQKLYKSENLSQLKFSEYANELISNIISTDAKKRLIQFSISSKIIKIGLESLVPIGLIINELTLNSLKHAFVEMKDSKIELNIRGDVHDKWIYMVYSDNGRWKTSEPAEYSFGQTLIESLVEQLDGTYKIKKEEDGTTFLFKLKNSIEPGLFS